LPKLFNNRVLLQALLALTFDLGGILSGRIALVFFPFFESAPWILALYPPMLSARGNIGGIFSGKLSTMLHIGEAEPRLRGNTREFYSLVGSIFFLTFVDTSGVGVLAFVINSFFGNASLQHLLFFAVVPPITSILAMSVAVPMVSLIGMMAFNKGIDPAILLYPAMSTIDDVLITICYVLVVGLALLPGALASMSAAAVLLGIVFSVICVRRRRERVFGRTLIEGGPMVLVSSLLGIFGGVALASLRGEIEKRPSVLMLYPALIDTLGDIGSILGTMETTKLALGYVTSFWETIREMFTDLVSVETAAAVMHVIFGLAAFLLGRETGLTPDLVLLIKIALVSNLMSFLLISLLSLLIATQTFKHGLDPDNFVIPLVTSVSDVGATLALIAAISVLGV